MRHALTIAGSDSCGGAGIQADLKTFAALNVYGMSVVTAVTAQNTLGVTAVEEISPGVVAAQIDAVFSDIRVDAVKIGMVASTELCRTIAARLTEWRPPYVVFDPVMTSKTGSPLLRPEAKDALINYLFPIADIITPNTYEAAMLVGHPVDTLPRMRAAAAEIVAMGVKSVIIKGGHLEQAPDVFYDGVVFREYRGERIVTSHTHGTGCTFSAAIAAGLAIGKPLAEAIAAAKEYITGAIRGAFALGKGTGPVHHFHSYYSPDSGKEGSLWKS